MPGSLSATPMADPEVINFHWSPKGCVVMVIPASLCPAHLCKHPPGLGLGLGTCTAAVQQTNGSSQFMRNFQRFVLVMWRIVNINHVNLFSSTW